MILKRILAELKELHSLYDGNLPEQNDPFIIDQSDDRDLQICFDLNIENNILKFKIPNRYPFTPPKMYINNINYLDMLYFNNAYFINKLNSIGKKCLCCETKLCPNNWRPSIRIKDIISEYLRNKQIIMKIMGEKYLNLINTSKNCILPPEIIDKICHFMEQIH